jgi:hypothetical protein
VIHTTLTKAHPLASCHLVLFQAPLTGPLSAPNDIKGRNNCRRRCAHARAELAAALRGGCWELILFKTAIRLIQRISGESRHIAYIFHLPTIASQSPAAKLFHHHHKGLPSMSRGLQRGVRYVRFQVVNHRIRWLGHPLLLSARGAVGSMQAAQVSPFALLTCSLGAPVSIVLCLVVSKT